MGNEAELKAQNLLDKISNRLPFYTKEEIKECAIVIIDEILKLDIYQSEAWEWESVKQKIEKL
jgi:hypothetical protein